MRIRSTKPEFWRSKTIAALPWDVRLVLKGLESYVDDNGVGKDDIALIAADVFPRDLSANPPETLARLTEAVSMLSQGGLIVRYVIAGEDLLYIDRWAELQRIDKPTRGRFPRPNGTYDYKDAVPRESYRSPPEVLASPPEKVAPVTGEQGNRGTGEQKTAELAGASSAPSPSSDVAILNTPTAQTIVTEWIDHCGERPPGRVIGQIAREIKTLLDEGIDSSRVRTAVAEWNRKGLHPSTLSSVVHEITNRKPTMRGQEATDALFDRAMQRAITLENRSTA